MPVSKLWPTLCGAPPCQGLQQPLVFSASHVWQSSGFCSYVSINALHKLFGGCSLTRVQVSYLP